MKKAAAKGEAFTRTDPEVAAFIAKLDPERGAVLAAIRAAVLEASPQIGEGIKWNAPSFRTSEFFATTNLHQKRAVRLILHTGAKARASGVGEGAVKDPAGLLVWLAKDRAMIAFADTETAMAGSKALQAIIKQWIRLL